jgi:endonuclease YncB( thermonuclease family)
VEEGDLAERMVALGFARPTAAADGALSAAMTVARKGELGLWSGGWRIRGSN